MPGIARLFLSLVNQALTGDTTSMIILGVVVLGVTGYFIFAPND